MGMKYLWDTNIIICFLQQQLSPQAVDFVDELLMTDRPCFSVITEIELLCWKTATPKDIRLIHDFIEDSTVIELETSIKYMTADIRKVHKIKLPDAIIAATAVVNELTLITRNVSDFKNISGLKLKNPWID
jgi:predicted nucleic acid-binding protein